MSKQLLGYVENDTPLHRLSGTSKLVALILISVACMTTYDTRFLIVISVLSLFLFKIAQIKWQQVSFVCKFIVVFSIINLLAVYLLAPQYGTEIYGSSHIIIGGFGQYNLTAEQLFYEFNLVLKYFCSIPIALIFILTTNPSEFAASLNRIGLSYRISYAVALAAMCYPAIQKSAVSAGDVLGQFLGSDYYITFMGIPVLSNDYTSSVVPVIVIIALAAQVQKIMKRIIPEIIANFFVPFFVLLISLPIGFLLIGPVITIMTNLLSSGFAWLYAASPLVMGIVTGFFWQVLVIFGLHWSLIPIAMINLGTLGYDNILVGMFGASFAQTAVVFAMYFKLKDQKLKSLCIPSVISGICGVTEPAIYGITLPKKKPFIFSMIGGAAGGVVMNVLGVKSYIMGGLGIFGIFNYLNPQTGDASGLFSSLICIAVSMVVGFVLTFFFWSDDTVVADAVPTNSVTNNIAPSVVKKEVITSPIAGEVVDLKNVQDDAFATEIMGKGVAVEPVNGEVVAPFDGTVMTLFPTKHAIGLVSDAGMELLIHIGLDTVQLDGKHFTSHVTQGAKVKQGDSLVSFDLAALKEEGYVTQVPIIVTNTTDYLDILPTQEKTVTTNSDLITVII